MTMVCVSTQPDRAHLMVDSIASDEPAGRRFHLTGGAKVRPLRRLDAAVTARGDCALAELWERWAVKAAEQVDDFDELADQAQEALPELVELLHAMVRDHGMVPPGDPHPMHAYLVGYSPGRERFVAYVYPSYEDFEPVDISDEMHVTPAPPGIKPTTLEVRHMQRQAAAVAAAGLPPVELPPGEPASEPTSAEQWAQLAQRVFRGRALATMDSGLKIPVGGNVTLTRLELGQARQQLVHTFTDEDFAAMIAGTLHPDAQLQPCQCGSGQRFLDCHLPSAGSPCPCMSSKRFADCCRVQVPAPAPAATAKVGRNAPCPCQSGRKYKKCCALVTA